MSDKSSEVSRVALTKRVSDNLRARSFTVAHVTGEKRPIVFLHDAEAEVERWTQKTMRLEREVERLERALAEYQQALNDTSGQPRPKRDA